MRTIDADALWMEIIHRMDYCDDILEMIEAMPPVEPETAQWKIHIDNDHQMLECSGCGNRVIRKWYDLAVGDDGFRHCPYCGRVMTNAKDMVVPWPGYREEEAEKNDL